MRLTIVDIKEYTGRGLTAYGHIQSGFAEIGDEVYVCGGGNSLHSIIVGIVSDGHFVEKAKQGEFCGLILRDLNITGLHSGMIICDRSNISDKSINDFSIKDPLNDSNRKEEVGYSNDSIFGQQKSNPANSPECSYSTKKSFPKRSMIMTIVDKREYEGKGVTVYGYLESESIEVGDKIFISGYGLSLKSVIMGIVSDGHLVPQAKYREYCGIILDNVNLWDIQCQMIITTSAVNKTIINTTDGQLSSQISSSTIFRPSSTYSHQKSQSLITSETETNNLNLMAIDKNKIEYVIGIDLGHGETSAAICPLQWDKLDNQLDPAKDLEMEPNRKVIPSSITITAEGTAKIGTAAFDPNILKQAKVRVCFKKKPDSITGESEQLMIRFMKKVYSKIRENNSGILTDNNHLIYIATPSGWDKEAQNLYFRMACDAGLPMGGITKESRAAFVRAQHDPTANLGRNIEKGAIVFDMGSSTLDFTYHNSALSKMIDNGYDCGASAVEKAMFKDLESTNDAIREFQAKYPDLVDYLLFEVRRAKEEIYFDITRKYKKTINFEDFIDDEDLEEERFRLKYEAGQLDEFLETEGYINSIRESMRDFLNNYISGQNIYGVFLTGGASRMSFIKPLVTECWGVPLEKIFRDQDPSLTISEGVAEVARADLRTKDIDADLKPLLESSNGNDVYDKFVEIFGNYMYENVIQAVSETCTEWRDSPIDLSLNDLNTQISSSVKGVVTQCSSRVNEGMQLALEEVTETLREKVEAIVAAYTAQGTNINMPSLSNFDVIKSDTGFDMSGVIHELSSSIQSESTNWGGLAAGAGIGVAAAMIFGGPLMWLIGGGAWLGSKLFGKEESEAEKRKKAMSMKLDGIKRIEIFSGLDQKWDNIQDSIHKSVFGSLQNNYNARRNVANAVNNLMSAYKDALKNARIMVD